MSVLVVSSLGGCRAPVTMHRLPSPVVHHQSDQLDPKVIAKMLDDAQRGLRPGEREGDAYRVGPGDTLLVAVYGHPELALAPYSSAGGALNTSVGTALPGGRNIGLVIDNDGTIQFPLVGPVKVAGKSTNELRAYLEQELARYVKEPKVTVQVVFNGSIRYYLLGQFSAPGVKFSDRPLRLLEAFSLGGSVIMERSNLRGAYVAREGKKLPVNFNALLRQGDLTQNIRLRTGDVLFVPDSTTEQAFVFGGVAGSNTRGGSVPFINGRLEITQALAMAGFGFRERTQGRLSRTRVIRSDGTRGEFFTVNVSSILKGDAAPFSLMPGDVVYVPMTGMTGWNQALEQLLPTLQTVSGLLNPYVQIKYLTRD